MSSMVDFRGKRFSVVSFQRQVSWTGLRPKICIDVVCLCHGFLYFLFSMCFAQGDHLWLGELIVSLTSNARWRMEPVSWIMCSTFSIACFYWGVCFYKWGIVSSLHGKRFSVMSFQRHGRGCIRRCVGVVYGMLCVSYVFFFPRVFVQDDDLWRAGSTVLTTRTIRPRAYTMTPFYRIHFMDFIQLFNF